MMFTNKRAIISCIVIIAVVLCCLTLFAGCSSQISDNNENNNIIDVNNTDINNTDKVQEISSEFKSSGASKPLPSQRIGTKCLSFYPAGEIIKVTSFMGDMYDYGKTPTYDTYGTNGYPVFEVYPCDGVLNTYNESSAVKINSALGKYEKVFSKDDMVSLNYPNYPHNLLDEECHSEVTELDFSQCKIGESGTIALTFGWHYDFPSYDGAMMFDGMRNFLGYYIGEDGVYLSFNGEEIAKNQYESNKNDATEIGRLPNNKHCSAKPLHRRPDLIIQI